MKRVCWMALGALLAMGLTALVLWPMQIVSRPAAVAFSQGSGLTIEKIQALSVLTTLKMGVAEVQLTEVQGYTGTIKAVLVIKGDLTVGVDLSKARFEQVDERARTAVLVLPQPQIQSVRLDQERTRLVGVWLSGLWTIVPGGEDADTAAVNLAYRDAQREVVAAAEEPQVLDRARQQTQNVLKVFLGALGWQVNVRWSRWPRGNGAAGPPGSRDESMSNFFLAIRVLRRLSFCTGSRRELIKIPQRGRGPLFRGVVPDELNAGELSVGDSEVEAWISFTT